MRTVIAVLLTTACMPHYATVEYEHISHPTITAPSLEDTVDHVSLCTGWSKDMFYAEGCTGYKLRIGGFRGDEITGTIRVGTVIAGSR